MQHYRIPDTFKEDFEEYFQAWLQSKKPKTKSLEQIMLEENDEEAFAKKPKILDINTEGDELKKELEEEFYKNFRTWRINNRKMSANDWFDYAIERLKHGHKLEDPVINNNQQPKIKYYGYNNNLNQNQNINNNVFDNQPPKSKYNGYNNYLNQNQNIENNAMNFSNDYYLRALQYPSNYEDINNNEFDSKDKNQNIPYGTDENANDAIKYVKNYLDGQELRSTSAFISVNNPHFVNPQFTDHNGIPVKGECGTLYDNLDKYNGEVLNILSSEKGNEVDLDNQSQFNQTATFAKTTKNKYNANLPHEIEKDDIEKILEKNIKRFEDLEDLEKGSNKYAPGSNTHDNVGTKEYLKYLDDTDKKISDFGKKLDGWCNQNPNFKRDQYQYTNPIRNNYNYIQYRKRYYKYALPKLNYNYDNISNLMDDDSYKFKLNFDYSKPYQPQRRRYNLHNYRYGPLRYRYY